MRTNAGNDMVSAQIAGAGGTNVAKYMAVTANSATPASGDTTLPGEIATAGGGLVRAIAAYAHTTGASTFTLTRTITANASDALPVTLAKIGVLDQASGGTLVYETPLSANATLSAPGDNVTITHTVTF